MSTIVIPVIRAHQNIGDLYNGVMSAKDLFDIAEADRIRLKNLEVPKYAGYQRALVPDRVEAIRDYLTTPRSTFPNAIIISLDSEYINEWENIKNGFSEGSILTIRREIGAARIIDGQHRGAALDVAAEDFHVIVTIFVDLVTPKCAEIFAKINSTQKAVNPSIAFQLFGYAEDRSPQRTAHEIAQTLNTSDRSPFYKKLRMLGTKDHWAEGGLSQSTFCKEMMRLYVKNPEQDENRLLRGEELDSYPRYPLRSFFIERTDKKILEVMWKFFYHVATTWRDQWQDVDGDSVLTKTTGYAAFMRVLRQWLLGKRAQEVLADVDVK